MIRNTQESYDQLTKTFDEFTKFSGLTINYEKTQILHIGTTNNWVRINTNRPLRWVDNVKILGINFVADTERLLQLNIVDIVKKVDMLRQSCKTRSITPLGKITFVNPLITLKFVDKLMVLQSPTQEFFEKISKRIGDFVWSNVTMRINYTQSIQKYMGHARN